MNLSLKQLVFLVLLGFCIGIGTTWVEQSNVSDGMASSLSNIEPASGFAVGSEIGGPFYLTDHNGTKVTDRNYADAYKLVFFGFTHCPEICPTELSKLADVIDGLGEDSQRLKTLFISVDPNRDTPEVMKEYVQMFHPKIIGLTGSSQEINNLKDSYKIFAAKAPGSVPGSYSMDHSSFIFLMDPQGNFVELFSSDDSASDIISVMREVI